MSWTKLAPDHLFSNRRRIIAIGIGIPILLSFVLIGYSGLTGILTSESPTIRINTNLASFTAESQYGKINIRVDVENNGKTTMRNASLRVNGSLLQTKALESFKPVSEQPIPFEGALSLGSESSYFYTSFDFDTTLYADGKYNISIEVRDSANSLLMDYEIISFDNFASSPTDYTISIPSVIIRSTVGNLRLTNTDPNVELRIYRNNSFVYTHRLGQYLHSINSSSIGFWNYRIDVFDGRFYIRNETFLVEIIDYPVIAIRFPTLVGHNDSANISFSYSGSVEPQFEILCPSLSLIANRSGNSSFQLNTSIISAFDYIIRIYLRGVFWSEDYYAIEVFNQSVFVSIPEYPLFAISFPSPIYQFNIANLSVFCLEGDNNTRYNVTCEEYDPMLGELSNESISFVIPTSAVQELHYKLVVAYNGSNIYNSSFSIPVLANLPLSQAFILDYPQIVLLDANATIDLRIGDNYNILLIEEESSDIHIFTEGNYSLIVNTSSVLIRHYSYWVYVNAQFLFSDDFSIEILAPITNSFEFNYTEIIIVHENMQVNITISDSAIQIGLRYANESSYLKLFNLGTEGYLLPLSLSGNYSFVLDIFYAEHLIESISFSVVVNNPISNTGLITNLLIVSMGVAIALIVGRILYRKKE